MVAAGFDAALCAPGGGDDPVTCLREACAASGGLLVLLVSTTGDGEVPKNMVRFWRALLKKSLPADSLGGVGFHRFATHADSMPARALLTLHTPLPSLFWPDDF